MDVQIHKFTAKNPDQGFHDRLFITVEVEPGITNIQEITLTQKGNMITGTAQIRSSRKTKEILADWKERMEPDYNFEYTKKL